MYSGKIVFSQLMHALPRYQFDKCVARYQGNKWVRDFTCWCQFLCLAFAQLSYRESLRDIEVTINSHHNKLYHVGLQSRVTRSTLADANEKRDWRIYHDFAHCLIPIATRLYRDEPLPVDIENELYALDSTTIDLCLSLFPWAHFRKTKAAIKLHTLLDLRGSIPVFIVVTEGKTHDVKVMNQVPTPPDSFQVMDRGYLDFEKLYRIHLVPAYFVIRAKRRFQFRRIRSFPVEKSTGLQCDQIIVLTGYQSQKQYPEQLRRVRYFDSELDKRFVFLTNNFIVEAKTVADIYRCRWQVELFFKWIKGHLRIKAFYGTSENAVKTQIWTAICAYLLVAIAKKQWNIPVGMHTFLQILEVNLFEKRPINQIVREAMDFGIDHQIYNQLKLFDF
jgi:hypothetical protein